MSKKNNGGPHSVGGVGVGGAAFGTQRIDKTIHRMINRGVIDPLGLRSFEMEAREICDSMRLETPVIGGKPRYPGVEMERALRCLEREMI